MAQNKLILLFFLGILALISTVEIRAETLDSSQTNKSEQNSYQFDIGLEGAELYYSNRPFAANNYTFLIGQRFTSQPYQNFGWRFVSVNSHLKEEHIHSLFWTHGNTDGLNSILTVQKLYFDYYIHFSFKAKNFEIIPVVSVVGGYRNFQYSTNRTTFSLIQEFGLDRFLIYRNIVDNNPQLATAYALNVDPNYPTYALLRPYSSPWTEQAGFNSSSLGLAARIKFLFFSLLFVEFYIDASYEAPPAHSFWLGDFHGTPPPRTGSFGWTNIGFQISW